MGVFMKEIISFFVVSGGVGFFNLYLAQETDFLYFGKYNKEERLAWLSFFTVVNVLIVLIWIKAIEHLKNNVWFFAIGGVISILISLSVSFLFPKIINETIDGIRKSLKKSNRTYLPPINTFFQDIENYHLFSFGFDGNFISSGKIMQGTEERQTDLSVLIKPNIPDEEITYSVFLKDMTKLAQQGELSMLEYTDYNNKIHLIKIKKISK